LHNGNLLYKDEATQRIETRNYIQNFINSIQSKGHNNKIVIIIDPSTQHFLPDILENSKQNKNFKFEICYKQQLQDPSLLYYGAGNVVKKALSVFTYPVEMLNNNLLYKTEYYTRISDMIGNINTLSGLFPKHYAKKLVNWIREEMKKHPIYRTISNVYNKIKDYMTDVGDRIKSFFGFKVENKTPSEEFLEFLKNNKIPKNVSITTDPGLTFFAPNAQESKIHNDLNNKLSSVRENGNSVEDNPAAPTLNENVNLNAEAAPIENAYKKAPTSDQYNQIEKTTNNEPSKFSLSSVFRKVKACFGL
jgi:hypothetical protein